MRRFTFALAIVLAGCNSNIPLPPSQYDHAPAVEFQDYRLPWHAVDNACRTFGATKVPGRILGCVVPGSVPLRIIANDLSPDDEVALIRHENGHLNGWPKDHPGARF